MEASSPRVMETVLDLMGQEEALALFGLRDSRLKLLKERFDIQVVARNGVLKLRGDGANVEAASGVVKLLLARLRAGAEITDEQFVEVAGPKPRPFEQGAAEVPLADIAIGNYAGRSDGQRRYLELMATHEIVICTGPAGSGKTFLAVLMAVDHLRRGLVRKICLVRPAVEAGERLGFLPGDIAAKVNPYLRPLYDALNEILDYETTKKYLERDIIEICPLAFMRGRTLNRSYIILDEAQNTTREQMKMFLTRMGQGSRIVVTGDVTQVDLPHGKRSGLSHVQGLLRAVEGIAFHEMTGRDIVRHPLVTRIVHAYEGEKPEKRR